jgi:hypothetical protein
LKKGIDTKACDMNSPDGYSESRGVQDQVIEIPNNERLSLEDINFISYQINSHVAEFS